MGRLMHFELHKLIRQKSFYICLIVAVALLFATVYTTVLLTKDTAEPADVGVDGMDVMIGAVSGGALNMVIGVFVPLFVCEDYASGTIRNIITRGYTRLGIFSAKLISVLLAAAVMTLACIASGYIIGAVLGGAGEQSFDASVVKLLLCQLAVMLAEAALFYAVSSILQKTGGAIAICLVLPMVMSILLALADTALAEKEIELSGYWIDSISSTLNSFEASGDDMKKALLASLCYFAAASAGSFLLISKREY